MENLGGIVKHPEEWYGLLKLKMAEKQAERQIPSSEQPHWKFCYSMLPKVSRSFALLIRQLPSELQDAVCVMYLVLRALDTVEDDTSIPIDVKVPILIAFHTYIYDPHWHFSCGSKDFKVLMDHFHYVSTAFRLIKKSYQEVIEDITKRMGAGMAKFICKEVETIDEYDEYCHYVSGLVGVGLSNLFYASGFEDLAPDNLSNSVGLFLQKMTVIRDYLEDINEVPKSRMFWPRQIWNKYANQLEDLKSEENSGKAVECLNEMVTNALIHMDDCFQYISTLQNPLIFRFCVIPQVLAMGGLATYYNNVQIFRGVVKMRPGLAAKVINRTKTMADVYRAVFDFCSIIKYKIDWNDSNAEETLKRVEAIQKTCKESGLLNTRKPYITGSNPIYKQSNSIYKSRLVVLVLIVSAIILAYLRKKDYN